MKSREQVTTSNRLWGVALPLTCCVLLVAAAYQTSQITPTTTRVADDTSAQALPKIGVVLSYDDTYAWQQQIVEGIETTIQGQARAIYFEMNTLGQTNAAIAASGHEAVAWVDNQQLDALIVADDHAMRRVAMSSELKFQGPIVFCGVNWPASTYQLEHRDIQGMVEFTSAGQLLEMLNGKIPAKGKVLILGANRRTDIASAEGFRQLDAAASLEIDVALVTTFDEWADRFVAAQSDYDLIYLLNNAGISEWDDKKARKLTRDHTATLTATEYSWMSELAMVSAIKSGQEQGGWAAGTALACLKAPEASDFSIVLNREMRVEINGELLALAGLDLPEVITVLAEASP